MHPVTAFLKSQLISAQKLTRYWLNYKSLSYPKAPKQRFSDEIKGDAAELSTLIQNLLDNAIKFTPAGGQVDVQLSEQDETVQLTVADTGIGIPEKDIPHLFSRFHRGRNTSAYPGNGLGLAIVKAIADQHKANISVQSSSAGTVFTVDF